MHFVREELHVSESDLLGLREPSAAHDSISI
jgi:hypothetical protein